MKLIENHRNFLFILPALLSFPQSNNNFLPKTSSKFKIEAMHMASRCDYIGKKI